MEVKRSVYMSDLNYQEEDILTYFETAFLTNSSYNVKHAANYLTQFHYITLMNCCFKNEKFKNFCQTNDALHAELALLLKRFGYTNVALKSMDNSEFHSIFDLFLAALAMKIYYDNFAFARRSLEARNCGFKALDTACQLGLYHALIEKCRHSIKNIAKHSSAKEEIKEYLSLLINDINRLTNLYWSMGYVMAGVMLQEVGNYFLTTQNDQEQGKFFHEQAIKKFLCATLLSDAPISLQIIHSLNPEQGYLKVLEPLHVKTWQEFQQLLAKWIGEEEYARILALAKNEIH